MDKNGNGPEEKKVIDFREAHRKKEKKRNARRRNQIVALAVVVALLIAVGIFLFTQINEVVNGKSFWQNFSSGAEAAALLIDQGEGIV